MVFIKAISYYLPELILTNEDIAKKFPEYSIEKISGKIGVSQRHIAAEDEFVSDMAVKAGKKLFEDHNIKPTDIDFILLCTQSPDYILPTTACIVQNKLLIPKSCGALDFNLGCSGYVYGLSLAKGLISGGMAKNVLLITSETYSKHIHPEDKSNLTIFGDAATATLVSTSGYAEIADFVFGTDGAGAENLIIKNGGAKFPLKKFSENKGYVSTNEDYLYMNGTEIFNFTLEAVPSLVEDTLKKNKLSKNQINHFIFHQANKFMLSHLQKKLTIPDEKFFNDMQTHGNTVSSTIPLAIASLIDSQSIQNDDKAMLAGFGVGYSWSGCILNFIK